MTQDLKKTEQAVADIITNFRLYDREIKKAIVGQEETIDQVAHSRFFPEVTHCLKAYPDSRKHL
jgi:hypothetical protein